jgi:hypothetical protein
MEEFDFVFHYCKFFVRCQLNNIAYNNRNKGCIIPSYSFFAPEKFYFEIESQPIKLTLLFYRFKETFFYTTFNARK